MKDEVQKKAMDQFMIFKSQTRELGNAVTEVFQPRSNMIFEKLTLSFFLKLNQWRIGNRKLFRY